MARPTSRPARAATMAALLTAPLAATALAAVYLPLIAVAAILIATLVASLIVTGKLLNPSGKATGVAVTCVILALIGTVIDVPLLILHTRGERVTATVTADRVSYSKAGSTYKYRLRTPDGHPIHGELSEPDDEFEVGDQVDVIYDPAGVANPNDVDFVADLGPLLAAGILTLWATTLILCVLATANAPRT